MRLLFMGPPGAGKGTQALTLSKKLSVPQISTGDIFRQNADDQTEVGQTAQRYMDAGEYVPDEVTNEMVRARLAEPDAREGFLLDGYPRTVDQVETLDSILDALDEKLEAVVVLTVDPEELIKRLLKRAETSGRTDDTEKVIRYRQEVYDEQTAPLLEVYRDRGILVEVDGIGDVDEVSARILDALPAETDKS